jgi:hypothetical protein
MKLPRYNELVAFSIGAEWQYLEVIRLELTALQGCNAYIPHVHIILSLEAPI